MNYLRNNVVRTFFSPTFKISSLFAGLAIVAMGLQAGCMAISILPGAEVSLPPQEGVERKRILQLNMVAGENNLAALNVGGYNESEGAIISIGLFNRALYSALNAGLANQSVFSAISIGITNESALGWVQLALLINRGWSFVNIAPFNFGGGVQIGLMNSGTSAIQLGLVNACDDLILPVFAYCLD